jgi:hypothetical protein
MLTRIAALAAAVLLACAPASAQLDTRTLPQAAPLTGSEKMPAVQGAGCPSKTAPCASVAVTPSLISAYLGATLQPRDSDLDAIAALSTVDYGRQLLTNVDAASARATLGGVAWAACKSGTAVSVTGTTTETTAATCTLPAGGIGPNGYVEVLPAFTYNVTAGVKTMAVRLGGSLIWSTTGTTTAGWRPILAFWNTGSQNAQASWASANGLASLGSSAALVRTTVNTAAATTLTITCQVAVTTDTCTLESYLVRITYGA